MTPDQIGPVLSRTKPRLLAVVFAVMVVLFVVTGLVTGFYNREKRSRAEQQFEAGQKLTKAGEYEKAVEMYSEALTLSRGKGRYRQYLQALALALVKAGRASEAETYLSELTAADPANGIANLMLARIYLGEGDRERAMQHYQRAIYGLWDNDPVGNRIKVRFELVDVLEKNGEYREVVAELFRLLDEIPDDPEMKNHIGRLFLAAHAYNEAAALYTEVTQNHRRDAAAWAGLGDAEFEMGHYLSARTAYRQALRYAPEDLQSQMQYDLASEVIGLDPMLRRLGSATRLARSQKLVSRALKAIEYCLPEDLETLPEEFRKKLEEARAISQNKARQKRSAEAVEQNIALAEALEAYRRENCGIPSVPDQALELVLKKLAQ